MQVVTVTDRGNGRRTTYRGGYEGRQCKHCRRRMRPGQRALRVTDYDFIHMTCLADMVRDEPEFLTEDKRAEVDDEFERLRQRLLAEVGNE